MNENLFINSNKIIKKIKITDKFLYKYNIIYNKYYYGRYLTQLSFFILFFFVLFFAVLLYSFSYKVDLLYYNVFTLLLFFIGFSIHALVTIVPHHNKITNFQRKLNLLEKEYENIIENNIDSLYQYLLLNKNANIDPIHIENIVIQYKKKYYKDKNVDELLRQALINKKEVSTIILND